MSIERTVVDDVAVLTFDRRDIDQLLSEVATTLDEGHRRVLLNLEDVPTLQGDGIEVLTDAHFRCRDAGALLGLCKLSRDMQAVIRILGLDELFRFMGKTVSGTILEMVETEPGEPEPEDEPVGEADEAEAIEEPDIALEEPGETDEAEAIEEPDIALEEPGEADDAEAIEEPDIALEEPGEADEAEAIEEPDIALEEPGEADEAEAIEEPDLALEEPGEPDDAEAIEEPDLALEEPPGEPGEAEALEDIALDVGAATEPGSPLDESSGSGEMSEGGPEKAVPAPAAASPPLPAGNVASENGMTAPGTTLDRRALSQFVARERAYARVALSKGVATVQFLQRLLSEQEEGGYQTRIGERLLSLELITEEQDTWIQSCVEAWEEEQKELARQVPGAPAEGEETDAISAAFEAEGVTPTPELEPVDPSEAADLLAATMERHEKESRTRNGETGSGVFRSESASTTDELSAAVGTVELDEESTLPDETEASSPDAPDELTAAFGDVELDEEPPPPDEAAKETPSPDAPDELTAAFGDVELDEEPPPPDEAAEETPSPDAPDELTAAFGDVELDEEPPPPDEAAEAPPSPDAPDELTAAFGDVELDEEPPPPDESAEEAPSSDAPDELTAAFGDVELDEAVESGEEAESQKEGDEVTTAVGNVESEEEEEEDELSTAFEELEPVTDDESAEETVPVDAPEPEAAPVSETEAEAEPTEDSLPELEPPAPVAEEELDEEAFTASSAPPSDSIPDLEPPPVDEPDEDAPEGEDAEHSALARELVAGSQTDDESEVASFETGEWVVPEPPRARAKEEEEPKPIQLINRDLIQKLLRYRRLTLNWGRLMDVEDNNE